MKSALEVVSDFVKGRLEALGICESCQSLVRVEYGKHGTDVFVNYKPVLYSKCDCHDDTLWSKIEEQLKDNK